MPRPTAPFTAMLLLAVATMSTAAPAAAPPSAQARIDRDWRAVRAQGAAQDCVPITGIRETRVRDDRTIDFVMRGGAVLRNTLPQSCPRLGFERAFGYATSLSRLCSVDIITVIDRTGGGLNRGPSCGLGAFQPVVPAK